MADELRIGLQELMRKAQMEGDADFFREGVRVLAQALMEIEVEQRVGAGRHERTEGRSGHRNGYRARSLDTRAGTVELSVPRVRDSSYFPSLLEPSRRAERTLSAVVQEAYVHGRRRWRRLQSILYRGRDKAEDPSVVFSGRGRGPLSLHLSRLLNPPIGPIAALSGVY